MSNTGALDTRPFGRQIQRFEKLLGHDWLQIGAAGEKRPAGMATPIDLVGLTLFALVIFSLTGIWYLGSDDTGYIGAARNWVHHFPYISNFFGDLRHPVVLPIAASFALFGESELAACLPTLLYSVGVVLLTYFYMSRLTDRATALLAAVLVTCLPLLGELSTTPNVDVAELFFVAASLLTFFYATLRVDRPMLFFLAGISAGLAFLCRETSGALILFFGVLFLAGFGRRINYWIMAAGFMAVFGSEMILYWATVGDPLYRFKMVASIVTSSGGDRVAGSGALDFGAQGVFHISPLLDSVLFVFSHPKFALMFVAGTAAFVWSAREAAGRKDRTRLIRHFFLFAVLSLLVVEIGTRNLAQVPRYRLVSAYAMILAASIWLRSGLWKQHRKAAVSIITVLLFAEFAGTAISNNNPNFALRDLSSLAASSRRPIHTDVETSFRGRDLYAWGKVAKQVISAPPGDGDLFFYNPKFRGIHNIRTSRIDEQAYAPKPDWIVLQKFYQPETIGSLTLRLTGMGKLLPASFLGRMRDTEPAVLYRVAR